VSTAPRSERIARQRRHTLAFLGEVRSVSPVFLGADVDLTRVLEHRAAARTRGARYSLVTYILHAAARVMAAHPDANAALAGRWRLRVAHPTHVHGKLALDKTVDGHRIVLSAVLQDLDVADLDDIQSRIDHYRDGDPARLPEYAPARLLHRLPRPLGSILIRVAARSATRRPTAYGTFAVTSLGHRPVDDFYSVGGPTITIGVGRYTDRPVARAGRIEIAPVLRLSLTFDHRVIDGAEAADVLADLVAALEQYAAASTPDADTDATAEPSSYAPTAQLG
jgi:pyruvate/2-oxoglutarate dehydrogenase complex dihydrolipoamide acyltransferase (E2) component